MTRLASLLVFARFAFGCTSPCYCPFLYSLGSPSAAPRPATAPSCIRSARLRLHLARLLPLLVFARLAFGCASPCYCPFLYSLGSPSAAPRPATAPSCIRSARLRLHLALLLVVLQIPAQPFLGAEDPGLHGAHGAVHDACHILQGQPLDLGQQERRLELLGQLRQGPL